MNFSEGIANPPALGDNALVAVWTSISPWRVPVMTDLCEIRAVPGCLVVTALEKVDQHTFEDLLKTVSAQLREPPPPVVLLNLKRLRTLPKNQLRKLGDFHVHLKREGIQLRLCETPDQVQAFLIDTRLDLIDFVYESQEAALANLPQPPAAPAPPKPAKPREIKLIMDQSQPASTAAPTGKPARKSQAGDSSLGILFGETFSGFFRKSSGELETLDPAAAAPTPPASVPPEVTLKLDGIEGRTVSPSADTQSFTLPGAPTVETPTYPAVPPASPPRPAPLPAREPSRSSRISIAGFLESVGEYARPALGLLATLALLAGLGYGVLRLMSGSGDQVAAAAGPGQAQELLQSYERLTPVPAGSAEWQAFVQATTPSAGNAVQELSRKGASRTSDETRLLQVYRDILTLTAHPERNQELLNQARKGAGLPVLPGKPGSK